jgi:hypothetical protein
MLYEIKSDGTMVADFGLEQAKDMMRLYDMGDDMGDLRPTDEPASNPPGWDSIDTSTDDVPNLDEMDIDELATYSNAVYQTNFPADVKERLSQYTGFKALAMQRRTTGEIRVAESFERTCERLYRELPESYRW